MVSEAEIEKRIAEEQAKIEVPSYQDEVWTGTWKRRAGALWGLMGLAMVVGAVIGLLAPLFPILGGMPAVEAVALIPKSIAIFSAIGISTGLAIGSVMGPSAGASAAAIREYERRQIAREIEETIRRNPEADVSLVAKGVALQEEDKEKNIRWTDYFNLKTGLLFSGLGAAGGLVFATALAAVPGADNFAMPAMNWLLGESVKIPAVVTAYSMGLGSLFGLNFGVSHALITNKAVNYANDLLGGKALGEPWPRRVNVPEPKPVLSPVVHVKENGDGPEATPTKFAEKLQRAANYESLVAQSVKETEGCNSRA
ncbi:MAG: hypothetical protein SFX19_09405 [Alphaproteobacteria bacterium]|nr:hypothetical protein [Alphaproteobacteria bacterium]